MHVQLNLANTSPDQNVSIVGGKIISVVLPENAGRVLFGSRSAFLTDSAHDDKLWTYRKLPDSLTELEKSADNSLRILAQAFEAAQRAKVLEVVNLG